MTAQLPNGDVLDLRPATGRPANLIRGSLKGSYTPLPQNLNGQLVVTANGEPVARWAVEADGVIDRWVDLPDRLLTRSTDLAVMIDATGTTGQCGESLPLTLTVDDFANPQSARGPEAT